jgi:hypothetical protein
MDSYGIHYRYGWFSCGKFRPSFHNRKYLRKIGCIPALREATGKVNNRPGTSNFV